MAVRGSLAWMAGAQGSSFLLQFASTVFLARLLTPYDMGVFAVAAAIVGALALIQAFGLENMIIREHQLSDEIIATAFSVNALISLVLSTLIVACAFLGGAFLKDPGVRQVLLLLAILPVVGIPGFLPTAQLERRGKFRPISIVNTLRGLVTSVATIIFALMGYRYLSIAYAQLIGQAFAVGLFCWIGREYLVFKFGFKEFRATARFGVQMVAISGVTELARRSSEIIMAKLLGLPALGIYSRGSSLNGLLWDRLHLILGRVLFVDFAEHKRRGLSLREKYLATLEMITALLWPGFAGLAILAGPFILTVYGAKWVPAATPLAWIAIASLIQVSITMTWEVFVACGELRTQMRIEFIRASASLAMFAAGCTISLTAAAASRVGDAVFAVVLYRPFLQRMTDTTFADFLPIYLRSGVLTILAILPGSILMIVYKGSAHAPISLAVAATGVGVVLWLLGLAVLQHPLLREAQAWLTPRRTPRESPALEGDPL